MQMNSPGGGLANYLSNHPATEDRVNALQAQTRNLNQNTSPLMSAEEWATAREVCSAK
jgi:predicted Zn-dependent protease